MKTQAKARPSPSTKGKEEVVLLPHSKVLVSDLNTRQPTEAEVKASGFVQSIQELGQTTPALVRPHPTKKGYYELAAGARRRTACVVLDQPVKCVVRDIPDDEFEDIIFADNFQRADPDPLAEAALVARRLAAGASEKTLAHRYGQSVLWVQRRAKLAQLDPAIAKKWRKPDSEFRHWDVEMMEHLALFSVDRQNELMKDWNVLHARNVKDLRQKTEQRTCKLNVDWLDNPATFVEGCGPGCATDSSKENSLFGFSDKKECGHCLKPACFKLRAGLAADAAATRVVEKAGLDARQVKAAFYTGYKGHDDPTLLGALSIKAGEDTSTFNVVRDYELQGYEIVRLKAKEKPHADAVLALDVTKPDKPVIVVLKARKGSAQAKKLAAAKKKTDPAAAQADKIAAFQARRWSKVRDRLNKALGKATTPNLSDRQWALLAAWFGTRSNQGYIADKPREDLWDLDAALPFDSLWNDIRPILGQRLFRIQKTDDFTKPHVLTELRGVAGLIGFDLDAAKREVDLTEIPIPKGWGKGIDPHTCLPVSQVPDRPEDTSWNNPKTLQQARKALSLDTATVLGTVAKFKDDRTYLMALHHCEKMGKARKAVLKAISDVREVPYGKDAPTPTPSAIDDEE